MISFDQLDQGVFNLSSGHGQIYSNKYIQIKIEMPDERLCRFWTKSISANIFLKVIEESINFKTKFLSLYFSAIRLSKL
jgi:hypothetical protein